MLFVTRNWPFQDIGTRVFQRPYISIANVLNEGLFIQEPEDKGCVIR
jgi:hypothetical protein